MESIQDLAPEIQKRISNLVDYFSKSGIKRPEVKFISSILTSMLKKHHIHLTVLSRSLNEPIAPKKTWERLNRNLSKKGMGDDIIESNMRLNAKKIKSLPYCVIELSDLQKPEAEKMEGLSRYSPYQIYE